MKAIISITVALAVATFPALGQQYAVDWFTVDGGGTSSSVGGDYAIAGTAGQPDAGAMSGGSFAVHGGFWVIDAAVPAPEIVWTNHLGGDWHLASNWRPNRVPGSGDRAILDGSYTVTISAAATVAGLTLAGPTLNGDGELIVKGNFSWLGGTIDGKNAIHADGGLNISGPSPKTLTGRTLVNSGAGSWRQGSIFMGSGAVLENSASGTFDFVSDGTIYNNGGDPAVINNAGLLRKTAGAGATTINSPIAFNNSGTVAVQSGTLSLNGGGAHTGTFEISTILDLGGGVHQLIAGHVTGSGTLAVSGGTANFSDRAGLDSILTVSGGTANFNGTGLISPARINVSSGTLGGENNITTAGLMTWTGGTIDGANYLYANGGLNISGSAPKTLTGRALVNGGTAVWSQGSIFMGDGGVLANQPDGIFDCVFDGTIYNNGGAPASIANAGLFRKTGGAGATTINSPIAFHNIGTVGVQSGTLSLNGGGTNTRDFTMLPGATLDLGGGRHDWTAGSVTGEGTIAITGGEGNFGGTLGLTSLLTVAGGVANFNGTGAIHPARISISSGTLGGNNTIKTAGLVTWTGGTIDGANEIMANGGLNISGSAPKTLTGRALVNTALAVWSQGSLFLGEGAVLANAESGRLECSFDGTMYNNGGAPAAVVNEGIFRKIAGAGLTTINSPIDFNNTGTVEIQSGTLSLNGGGAHIGDFDMAANATLDFGGGIHLLPAGNLTGPGTVAITGGTANFSGTLALSSILAVSGGVANFTGAGIITPSRILISSGTLGGDNTLTAIGPIAWTGGTIDGANQIFANGGLTISASAPKTLTGRTLVNTAAGLWSQGNLFLGEGGFLANAATGTFDCAFDGTMYNNGGAPASIANAGHFRKTAGAGVTTINNPIAFNNTGTVTVQSGTLSLNGGGTHTGNISIIANSTLDLGGAVHELTAGNITGAGTFRVSGGTANASGTLGLTSILTVSGGIANFNGGAAVLPARLNISAGTLGGDNTIKPSGLTTWTGGTIDGANEIITYGGLAISGSAPKTLTGRTLVNAAAGSWTQGSIFMGDGAVLANAEAGTFDCAFDGTMYNNGGAPASIANAGLFRKTAGAGTTAINNPIAFNNTGAVEIQRGVLALNGTFTQTSGTTRLNGGNISNTSPLNLNGGQLAGVGTITGSVINNAAVNPGVSPGKITINGAYTQGASGSLNIEIAGPTQGAQFDWLAVSGLATLNGALNVTFTGSFTPSLNALFTFLTCGSRSGTFASLNHPAEFGMRVNYAPTSATIEITNIEDPGLNIEILGVTVINEDVRVEWTAIGGRSYFVQAASALSEGPGVFQDISPMITAPGNGPITLNYIDSAGALHPFRFYRVRLVP